MGILDEGEEVAVMGQRQVSGKKLWWGSAGTLVVVAGVLAGTMFASAAGPALPARTPAQLLADMAQAKPPATFSGVITENANLGFPSLPNIAGLNSSTLSAANWISGTHTVDIWYGGPAHLRVAVPVPFGETDLRIDGSNVWLWNSHGQVATHLVLPARPAIARRFAVLAPGAVRRCVAPLRRRLIAARATGRPAPRNLRERLIKCLTGKIPLGAVKLPASGRIGTWAMTPQQVAKQLLAAVGPTTSVTVPGTTTVAGRSAYQLVLSPRTSESLIGRIVIDVDSQTYLPLGVQVYARGSGVQAFTVGFTGFSLAKPAASNFAFTPPAGAHVRTTKLGPAGLGLGVPGIVRLIGIGRAGRLVHRLLLPRIMRLRALRLHNGHRVHAALAPPVSLPVAPGQVTAAGLPGARVLGTGWLRVAVLPGVSALKALTGGGAHRRWFGSMPLRPGNRMAAARGQSAAALRAIVQVLLNAARPVHGSWGKGKLLSTTLFSALITSNGKVLIGAVTPAVLFADAAKVK
jgi:hypothetical protein